MSLAAPLRPATPLRLAAWIGVALLGAGSLAFVSLARGEPVNALWLVVASACVFALAWRFHSAWLLARVLALDDRRATPAERRRDGKDYVPTHRWIVFGHHFAAIAGPGPLVGPVLAAQFGYLPGLLWILVGATLGGAVHDCVILFCSVRRGGRSLGQIVREEVGPFAGLVSLLAIVSILVILIAVLGLVVVKALADSPWGLSTIAASMPIALAMGIAIRRGLPLLPVSLAGLAALLLAVWAGKWLPGTAWERWFTLSGTSLAWSIMLYGLGASILPVWLLLAPRDYLSSFLKVGVVALLAAAVIVVAPRLELPAVTKFVDGSGPVFAGPVFPFCCITIACAAVSGFHSLIASGTTPKLIAREADIRFVGYGAMITEMLVGVLALIAACALPAGQYFAINMKGDPAAVTAHVTALGYPVTADQMAALAASVGEKTLVGRTGGAPTFAVGMAHMFSRVLNTPGALALWYHFAILFEALFILTTIDAGTRVGRFLVQDLLGTAWRPLGRTDWLPGNVAASAAFVAAWGWFLYQGVVDPLGGINSLWPLFGIANQLLAVVALALGATVLLKMGRGRYAWTCFAPLAWLLAVTFTAGWMKIFSPDPRLGFLSAAAGLRAKIAGLELSAPDAPGLAALRAQLASNLVDAWVAALFLALVVLIVAACARVWFRLLAGWPGAVAPLGEEPFVPRAVTAEEEQAAEALSGI